MSDEIVIDPEFKALLPPLPDDEFSGLEQAIINDGCRDPLVVWFNDETLSPVLIDGHNRFEICQKHDIRFETVEMEFDSRDDVKIWMIRHQFARRNLIPYVKTTLALQLEPLLAAKAKQNQVARKGEQAGTSCQKSDNLITPIDTKKEVAKVAGVSHDTVAKVKLINNNRDLIDDDTVDDLRQNRRSINEVASRIKAEKARQEKERKEQERAEAKRQREEAIKAARENESFDLASISATKIELDDWYLTETWEQEKDRIQLLINEGEFKGSFNKQKGDSIEWAQWSWNPVTGCEHNCPYCYARDIASRFYEQKFAASIHPYRINIPQHENVPEEALTDVSYKNVFTCSMADLFGRWVPIEWIEWVMDSARRSPQWNFLFLTKFPQRIVELGELPVNAWMGTSVDCQDRVANAEKAFAKMTGGTKWLSIEPMLTPLKFKQLDLFDWVVIGGASESTQSPAWIPPMDWLVDLHKQARDAGCKIYYKTNLFLPNELRIKEFPWIDSAARQLPTSLKYLGIK